MKQDYVVALASLPAQDDPAQGVVPAALNMGAHSVPQPAAHGPQQGLLAHQSSSVHQAPQVPPPYAGMQTYAHSANGSAQMPWPHPQAGSAPHRQHQSAQRMSDSQSMSAAAYQRHGAQMPPAQHNADGMAAASMQDASQALLDDDICCAQQATNAPPIWQSTPSMPPLGANNTLPHDPARASGHHANPSVPARLSVASSANTSNVGRQSVSSNTDQHLSSMLNRPHWMRGGDGSAGGIVTDDAPAHGPVDVHSVAGNTAGAARHQGGSTAHISSAPPEKENTRPGTAGPYTISRSVTLALSQARLQHAAQ